MLQLILKSHLAFLLIPILAIAIEPSNPTELCERFIGEKDKTLCIEKTSQKDLDWYAASSCGLQQEDKNFMSCLDEVKGATFNPQALELCAKTAEISDQTRMTCLRQLKNKDYSRAQLKKCSEISETKAVTECLQSPASNRAPASKKNLDGFQSLEVQK